MGAIAAFTRSAWSTVVGRLLARLLRGIAPLVQSDGEHAQSLEGIGYRNDDVPEVVGGFANGLFEQREEQLVLAVEVLVEPA
jgi:hypothetical protein